MSQEEFSYSDLPATEDELNFLPAVNAMTRIIEGATRKSTPLTIGIYGAWGSGKTSIMQMILQKLDPNKCIPVWFDAWRYSQSDALWRALLFSVVEELRLFAEHDKSWVQDHIRYRQNLNPENTTSNIDSEMIVAEQKRISASLDDLSEILYRSIDREEPGEVQFQWDKAGKVILNIAIRAGFSYIPVIGDIAKATEKAQEELGAEGYGDKLLEMFQRKRARIYREQVRSLEQFYRDLKTLIGERVTNLDRKVVIFIDDLDRCLPEQAISVLESIKVFLDIQGCVFVLGMDREIVESGIRLRYHESQASSDGAFSLALRSRDYLEKIIQVPFDLPPPPTATISTFLNKRLRAMTSLSDEDLSRLVSLMTIAILPNPRKIKRTINTFYLILELDRAYGRASEVNLIAKLVVLQSSFPELYEFVAVDPISLRSIEQIVRGTPGAGAVTQSLREMVSRSHPRLKEMLYLAPFFDKLGDQELRDLVYRSLVTKERGEKTIGGITAKLAILEENFPRVFEQLIINPMILRDIELILQGRPHSGKIGKDLSQEIEQDSTRFSESFSRPPLFSDYSDDRLQEMITQYNNLREQDKNKTS